MLAIDCHPWHGVLALCVLTESECTDDSELRDPAEMAAWRFFNCSDGIDAWGATTALAQSMRSDCESAGDNASVATAYFHRCADAFGHSDVVGARSKLGPSPEFRLSVTHPDNGTEYVCHVAA